MSSKLIVRPSEPPKVLIYPCDMYAQAGGRKFFDRQHCTYEEIFPEEKHLVKMEAISNGIYGDSVQLQSLRVVRNSLRTGRFKEEYSKSDKIVIVGKMYRTVGRLFSQSQLRMKYVIGLAWSGSLRIERFESIEIDVPEGHCVGLTPARDCTMGETPEEVAVYNALCGYYPDFS